MGLWYQPRSKVPLWMHLWMRESWGVKRTPTMNGLETPSGAARVARAFPDEASCLEWLVTYLYPGGIVCRNRACARYGQVTKHHRVLSRRSYCCAHCGHHVHPTAGTIFHKSPTPLRLWFYAISLMASTRCEIPAREVQRQLGVTYKTAWRMCTQIRALLEEPAPPSDDGRPAGIGRAIASFVEAQTRDSTAVR